MKQVRKLLAILLVLSMCLSLMPVMGVAANVAVTPDPERFETDAKFLSEIGETNGNVMVVRYVAPGSDNTDANNTEYARIDYGVYKLSTSDTMSYQIYYDPDVAELQYCYGGDITDLAGVIEDYGSADAAKPLTLVPRQYGELTTLSSWKTKYFFANADAGMIVSPGTAALFTLPEANLITHQSDDGAYGFTIGVNTAVNATNLPKLTAKNGNNENSFNTTQVTDQIVYFASTYFKINGTVTPDTFNMNNYNGVVMGAEALIGNGDEVQEKVAMIGFLKAKEVINPVAVTFALTALEGNTDTLAAPKIMITRTSTLPEDATDDLATYSEFSWEAGKLTGKKANGQFENLDSLSLYPGDYTWTVTPTGTDTSSYLECTKSFTVEKNTPLEVKLYANDINANPVDYTLTVKNEVGNAVKDATVTITGVEGISTGNTYNPGSTASAAEGDKQAVTGQNGKVTFRARPNQSYPITIRADSFADQSGTVTTKLGGEFTLTGLSANDQNEIVMGTAKTSLSVTVKNEDDSIPENANIKVEWAGEGEPPVKMPITVPVGSDGKANLTLPDGKYNYTVNAPGKEPVKHTMEITTTPKGDGNNTVTVKVDEGETGATTLTKDSVGNANVTFTDADGKIENTVGAAMTDMFYLVEGKWDDKENPTQMTVTVSINNNPTDALHGTFGFQYDTNVFELLTPADIVYNTDAITLSEYPNTDTSKKVPNPTVPGSADNETTNEAYHAFTWEAKNDGTNVVPVATGTTLATYTLKVKTVDGVKVDVKEVMTDKSLSARSFLKTSAAAAFNDAGYDTSALPVVMMEYWQDVGAGTLHDGKDTSHKLADDKALDGGFYQVFLKDSVDGEDQRPYDIMMQIIFENLSSNKAIEFHVTDLEGTDQAGATVTLFDKTTGDQVTDKEGNPVMGITDQYGKVTVTLPDPNGDYVYRVEAPGFEAYPDSIRDDEHPYPYGKPLSEEKETNPDLADVIEVAMTPNNSANVIIEPDDKVTLLGANQTVVGTEYTFNVEAKPGYELANPLVIDTGISAKYYPIKEDGTLDRTAGEDVTLTWDAKANHFKTPTVEKDQTWTLVITVTEDTNGVQQKTDPYKVHVYADVAGGYFTVNETTDKKNDETYDVTPPATESDTYNFFTNGPVDAEEAAKAAKGEEYKAFVIKEFLVNGVALELTDPERIHGLSKKLVDITADQDITVTYEKATVDPGDPDTPGDDVIKDAPPAEPVGDAVVTVIVGDYGKVTVDSADQNGPSSKDYTVNVPEGGTGSFSLTVTPTDSGTMPDGTTTINPGDYVIDTVYVLTAAEDGSEVKTVLYSKFNSSEVTTSADAAWTGDPTNKLDLSNLTKGEHRTVVVSFVHKDSDASTQVFVETVNLEGNGNISASGLLPYTVGDEPVFTITPADKGWSLSKLTVKKPGAASAQSKRFYAEEVLDDDGNGTGVFTYKMEPLEAGTTELGYGFKENSYTVAITVHYGMMSANFNRFNNVEIKYVRVAGGDGTNQSGTATYTPAIAGVVGRHQLNLAAGTWTLTFSKKGYLDFVITDFTINDDGTVTTQVDGSEKATFIVTDAGSGKSYIDFGNIGSANDNTDRYVVAPVLGDADYDNLAVSLGDIAQVSNAMVAGAGTGSIAHADIDETLLANTAATNAGLTDDMSYVLKSFGKGVTKMRYDQFLNSASYKVGGTSSGFGS